MITPDLAMGRYPVHLTAMMLVSASPRSRLASRYRTRKTQALWFKNSPSGAFPALGSEFSPRIGRTWSSKHFRYRSRGVAVYTLAQSYRSREASIWKITHTPELREMRVFVYIHHTSFTARVSGVSYIHAVGERGRAQPIRQIVSMIVRKS